MNKSLKKIGRVYSFLFHLAPWFVILNIVLGLLSSLFPYVAIYFGAKIIDSIIAANPVSTTMAYVYWMISLDLVLGIAIAALTDYGRTYSSKLNRLLSEKITHKTMSLSYSEIEDQKTLRLIAAAQEGSNGSGGLDSFCDSLKMSIEKTSNLVYAFILLSALFVAGTPNKADWLGAFLSNPWSALVVFIPIILALICSAPMVGEINKLSYKAMKDNVEANRRFGYFYNLCANYEYGKDIRLYHMQPMIMKAQMDSKNDVNSVWGHYGIVSSFLQMAMIFLFALVGFASYAYLGLKAIYGLLSVGTAMSLVSTLILFSNSLSGLVTSIMQQGLSADYLQNYFLYLQLPTSLAYGTNHLDINKPLEIKFDHVSFHYPTSQEWALDDVSFTIKPQEKLAIVGLNGAGKTTMMKLICRFYEPNKGEILINDLPLRSYDQDSANRLYAIVFQDFKLFSYSVKDNVCSGDNGDEAKCVDALKKVGVYDRVMSFPDGIDTVLYNKNDENGVEISGGEAQKIAFARALYKDAPLIILDEPTSALDPKSEAEVYESLGALTKNKTSVFISHRMSSTKFCDEILVIKDGKIAESGNHESLLKKKDGLYKKMWDAQAQYYQ